MVKSYKALQWNVLVAMATAHLSSALNFRQSCAQKDTYLDNAAQLHSTKEVSRTGCVLSCSMFPKCLSVNYHEETGICLINQKPLGAWGPVKVGRQGWAYVSPYECDIELFWSQCDARGCGGSFYFRRDGNICYHLFTLKESTTNTMFGECRNLNSAPLKIESAAKEQYLFDWLADMHDAGYGYINIFTGAIGNACRTVPWAWANDGSVVMHGKPTTPPSRCYEALKMNRYSIGSTWATNHYNVICQRTCPIL